jgi:hypothetical protein
VGISEIEGNNRNRSTTIETKRDNRNRRGQQKQKETMETEA